VQYHRQMLTDKSRWPLAIAIMLRRRKCTNVNINDHSAEEISSALRTRSWVQPLRWKFWGWEVWGLGVGARGESCTLVFPGGCTSYSLVQKLLLWNVSFSHNAQRQRLTDRRTDRQLDDIIMPIADHTVCSTVG